VTPVRACGPLDAVSLCAFCCFIPPYPCLCFFFLSLLMFYLQKARPSFSVALNRKRPLVPLPSARLKSSMAVFFGGQVGTYLVSFFSFFSCRIVPFSFALLQVGSQGLIPDKPQIGAEITVYVHLRCFCRPLRSCPLIGSNLRFRLADFLYGIFANGTVDGRHGWY